MPSSIARRRLPFVLIGNALMRIAGAASGVLVGVYLAELGQRGFAVNAAVAGILGAVSFAAEMLGALPAGVLSDAVAPRVIMAAGALLGAAATQLFGMSGQAAIFYLSRTAEGLGAAATTPSLLAHLTEVTDSNDGLRARVMSYFELSLVAGLALGGVLAAQLWPLLHTAAFAAIASVYIGSGALLVFGAVETRGYGPEQALAGLKQALRETSLRRLAPVWLCVNAIIGLWLGPTFFYLLAHQKTRDGQMLDGIFAGAPERVGWVLLGYSVMFGAGVTGWSVVLPRIPLARALRISLCGMLAACVSMLLLNHSEGQSSAVRWGIGALGAGCVMVESGFTPAALALLAKTIGARAGRGGAMGIYSFLLSAGAIAGSLLAAALGERLAVDGLVYGTLAMALIAMTLARGLNGSGKI